MFGTWFKENIIAPRKEQIGAVYILDILHTRVCKNLRNVVPMGCCPFTKGSEWSQCG